MIGAWVQGYAWYHYELKRATAVRREEVLQRALEWQPVVGTTAFAEWI